MPEGWGTILYLFISLAEPSPFIKTASGCMCNQTFIRQARYIKKKKKTNNAQTPHTETHTDTHSHYTAIINLRNETSPFLQARKAGSAPPHEDPEAVGTPLETVAPSLAVHPALSVSFLLQSCDPRIWHLRLTGTCGAVCSPPAGQTQGGLSWRFHYPPRQVAHPVSGTHRALPCICSHIVIPGSELGSRGRLHRASAFTQSHFWVVGGVGSRRQLSRPWLSFPQPRPASRRRGRRRSGGTGLGSESTDGE